MLMNFLFDLSIVGACAALAIGVALAFRVQGAAACGVATAALATLALQMRGGGLAEIGLAGPPDLAALAPWIAGGLVACYAIAGLTTYALARLGLAPDVTRLDFIKGNLPALALMLAVSWTTAAFGEEVVFRGLLLNRAAGLDVNLEHWALWVVAGQAVMFGLAHAYQGLGGMIVTGILGAALGGLTVLAQGNLWPAIIVHGLINTVSLMAIYTGRSSATNITRESGSKAD